MVRIQLNVENNSLLNSNMEFMGSIPNTEDELSRDIADDLRDAIKREVTQRQLVDTGELRSNVEVTPSESGSGGQTYEVSANAYNSNGVNYAAWHEFAETGHFVPFYYNNRVYQPITRWAKENGVDDGAGIYVTPENQKNGSFMNPAVQKAIKNTRRALRTGDNPLYKNLAKAYGD